MNESIQTETVSCSNNNPQASIFILQAENITVRLDEKMVLQDVSFVVRRGELVGVVGPNGAGKTTLLKTLVGLLNQQSGSITWNNCCDVKIGYLPQNCEAVGFPISVKDLVMMGRTRRIGPGRLPKNHDKRRVQKSLQTVGLKRDVWCKNVNNVSGGQRRLALLAMMLAADSDVLLLDEPASSLDIPGQQRLYTTLKKLSRQGLSIIAVSHDLLTIGQFADRLLAIDRCIWADGSPENVFSSSDFFRCYGIEYNSEMGNLSEVMEKGAFSV